MAGTGIHVFKEARVVYCEPLCHEQAVRDVNVGHQSVCIVSMPDYTYSRRELVDVSFQIDARARRI